MMVENITSTLASYKRFYLTIKCDKIKSIEKNTRLFITPIPKPNNNQRISHGARSEYKCGKKSTS